MKKWIVRVIPEKPAYDDRGVEFDIDAPVKRMAISKARKLTRSTLAYDRWDGPLRYLASEVLDAPLAGNPKEPFASESLFSERVALQEASSPPPAHIGMLCRNGAPVYYTFPPHGAYREAPTWQALV